MWRNTSMTVTYYCHLINKFDSDRKLSFYSSVVLNNWHSFNHDAVWCFQRKQISPWNEIDEDWPFLTGNCVKSLKIANHSKQNIQSLIPLFSPQISPSTPSSHCFLYKYPISLPRPTVLSANLPLRLHHLPQSPRSRKTKLFPQLK